MNARGWRHIFVCTAVAASLCMRPAAFSATILVTNDYPTIQAAINAASSNDTVQIQAGVYREFLNIVAPVRIIGSGSTNCIVHHTNDVLVTITSAGTVEMTGIEICGGEVAFGGGFAPSVPRGIVASNSTVSLNDVALNLTRNFAVTVVNGSLYATNVSLYTRSLLEQWDVGFQLKGCVARFYNLTQLAGQIDHTININDPPANFSDVRVDHSTIRASHLGYGECVRTYTQSSVVITNCILYRAPGGAATSIGNQAIGINGYSNTVVITGNLIDALPTGIRVFGSIPNSNHITIEHNDITNSQSNGVYLASMSYEGVDLGGGPLQSAGDNFFANPGARDVELFSTPSGIHAISNCWTTANPDDSIFDQLDTNSLGRVTYNPTYCQIIALCTLAPALATNDIATAHTVTATVTTNGSAAAAANVIFDITSGPNTGQTTNTTTDATGQASFAYTGNSAGTDTIRAIATVTSLSVTGTAVKVWVGMSPLINCPADIVTNTAAGTCARTVTYNTSASGIPTPIVTFNPASGTSFSKGGTGVTATASNSVGTAQCTFTVTVHDNELPSITCTGDITTNIPFAQPQANVIFNAPTVDDNCGVATNYCAPQSGSTFALGTNSVACTVIDTAANSNTCTFKIIVLSLPAPNQPPIAQCSNTTVSADANCQATIPASAVDAGSFDSDGIIANRSLIPAGPFDIGTNNVTLTVFDNSGASNSCNSQIIVVDTTPPSIGPCAAVIANVLPGIANTIVSFPLPLTADNCGIATNYCSPASGSTFALGTNTVTCGAVDNADNTGTCSFAVIVLPYTAPDLSATVNLNSSTCTNISNRTVCTLNTMWTLQNHGTTYASLTGAVTQTCTTNATTITCRLAGALTVTQLDLSLVPTHAFTLYLSPDVTLDATDVLLLKKPVPLLKLLKPLTKPVAFKLKPKTPKNTNLSGKFILVVLDLINGVIETDETNNVAVLGPLP